MGCCFCRFTWSAGSWEKDPCWFWFLQSWSIGMIIGMIRFGFLKVFDISLIFYHFILVFKNKNIYSIHRTHQYFWCIFLTFSAPILSEFRFLFSPFVIRCYATDCLATPNFKLKRPPPQKKTQPEIWVRRRETRELPVRETWTCLTFQWAWGTTSSSISPRGIKTVRYSSFSDKFIHYQEPYPINFR